MTGFRKYRLGVSSVPVSQIPRQRDEAMGGNRAHVWMCGATVVAALVIAPVTERAFALRAVIGCGLTMVVMLRMMGGMATAARSGGRSAARAPGPRAAEGRSPLERVRMTPAAVGADVLGAAPHVLHHVGPPAGAAVLAGGTGKLLFGARRPDRPRADGRHRGPLRPASARRGTTHITERAS